MPVVAILCENAQIQPPPRDTSDPADVLKYLARYMTGGPISDRRLLEVREDRVYFLARATDKSGRQVRERLPAVEFVRRWTLHILPKGFTKSRCYGGWSNSRREEYQKQCEQLQPSPARTEPDVVEPPRTETEPAGERELTCPQCGERMALQSDTPRPPWRDLFYGPEHPRRVEWRGSG
jgi:hypothetical protein